MPPLHPLARWERLVPQHPLAHLPPWHQALLALLLGRLLAQLPVLLVEAEVEVSPCHGLPDLQRG